MADLAVMHACILQLWRVIGHWWTPSHWHWHRCAHPAEAHQLLPHGCKPGLPSALDHDPPNHVVAAGHKFDSVRQFELYHVKSMKSLYYSVLHALLSRCCEAAEGTLYQLAAARCRR